jgi:hypothetical protein
MTAGLRPIGLVPGLYGPASRKTRTRSGFAGCMRRDGGRILEYWVPAEDLPALNASIIGTIEVVSEFH